MKDNLLTRPPSALLSSIEAMVREGRFREMTLTPNLCQIIFVTSQLDSNFAQRLGTRYIFEKDFNNMEETAELRVGEKGVNFPLLTINF